jgi:hypothetical protein
MDSRDELVEEFQGRGFTREQAGTLADLWIAQDGLYAEVVKEATDARAAGKRPPESATRNKARAVNHKFFQTAARFERENAKES